MPRASSRNPNPDPHPNPHPNPSLDPHPGPNQARSYIWLQPVSLTITGMLTLLDNHEGIVTLSAATACLPSVQATVTTAANLAVSSKYTE